MILANLVLLMVTGNLSAVEPPSYAKQVKPFFARYCLECHNGDKPKGDLNLESFKGLQDGGKSGPVIVPNKPDESRLVLLGEHKDMPPMPPPKPKQPRPEEVAIVRAWVPAGAKDDAATLTVTIPDIKPRVPVLAPVSAIAYRPDGQLLAAGGHKEVLLIETA